MRENCYLDAAESLSALAAGRFSFIASRQPTAAGSALFARLFQTVALASRPQVRRASRPAARRGTGGGPPAKSRKQAANATSRQPSGGRLHRLSQTARLGGRQRSVSRHPSIP